MSPLFYLTACKAKNKFIELSRNPMKLILTLGFVLLLVINFSLSENSFSAERPLGEFKGVIFAFYILCFVFEVSKGFKSGGTMFTMADVNLLFMSPLKSVAILFHGMLSRLGSSLWMALAFVYQFALLRSLYPITMKHMLLAVGGYAVTLFLSQLAGMLVYSYSCGEKNKNKKIKIAFYSLCAFFALFAAVSFASSENFTAFGLARVITALPMRFFPVAGWAYTAVDGLIQGDIIKISLAVAACILFAVISFFILAFSKQGYYEDVLLTAEKDALRKESGKAAADIRVSEKSRGNQIRGNGASVVFFKHLIENRRSKSFLLSTSSLFYVVLICVYAFVFKNAMLPLFMMSCIACVLTVLSGRWVKELTMPYIYILPGSAVRKLFFMLPEMLPKLITESLLHCAVIGFACKLGIKTVAALFLARLAFSFVLTGSALLTARIYREKEKNNIFALICILLGFVFALPSVLCAMLVAFYGFGLVTAFIVMSAVNVAVGFVLLIFARKLLNFAD